MQSDPDGGSMTAGGPERLHPGESLPLRSRHGPMRVCVSFPAAVFRDKSVSESSVLLYITLYITLYATACAFHETGRIRRLALHRHGIGGRRDAAGAAQARGYFLRAASQLTTTVIG